MYHEETDTPALVRTMALNEELGQVTAAAAVAAVAKDKYVCNCYEGRRAVIR